MSVHADMHADEREAQNPATPSYNEIISSFMLNYGYSGPIRKLFPLLFLGINPSI